MATYSFKRFAKEISVETRIYKDVEFLNQFSIIFDEKKQLWIAREGRKIAYRNSDKLNLISAIYSVLQNRECSRLIDSIK